MKIRPLTFFIVVLIAAFLAHFYIIFRIVEFQGVDLVIEVDDSPPENVWIEFNSPTFYQGAFSRDGKTAIFGSQSKVCFFDLSTAREIRQIDLQRNLVIDITISPDGRTCFTGLWESIVHLWDVQTGELILTFDTPGPGTDHITKPGTSSWIQSALSPDGKTLFVKEQNGLARLWDAQTGTVLREIDREQGINEIHSVAYSPDGSHVLTARQDGTIKIWDTANGNLLHKLSHPKTRKVAIYSPDGRQIISAGYEGSIQIWDAQTGEPLHRFHHPNRVWSLCVSNDGVYLAAGGQKGIVQIWNLEERLLINRFETDKHGVNFLGFSSDNNQLFACDAKYIYQLNNAPPTQQNTAASKESIP